MLICNQNEITTEQIFKMLIKRPAETFQDCGDLYLEFDNGEIKADMIIAYHKNLGYYLHYYDILHNTEKLSLWEDSKLNEVVEYDEDCFASAGLFLPIEKVISAIMEFCNTGCISKQLRWIAPDEIPEDGNW